MVGFTGVVGLISGAVDGAEEVRPAVDGIKTVGVGDGGRDDVPRVVTDGVVG